MAGYTVHWLKEWGGPILPAAECEHEGPDALTINQRLEPNAKGAGRHIALDGNFCMRCGTDSTGRFTIAEAMHLCMSQHGWNRPVGERLYDLAEHHKDELLQSGPIPIWCFSAFGMSGREIVDGLNNGTLLPGHMSEEVEQLADAIDPLKQDRAA